MAIRLTEAKDWMLLKQVRLAALLDTPTAFGVSYQTAAQYSDEQWKERASNFYLKQGFSFIDEWEPLVSHPHIRVQTMLWTVRN
ncbi:hypothetical protein [Pseudomonas sp. GL-B-26]|jgi:hypothetical protein|uniref:hypothetical protein n=1 Tax=Pseudomonas sp. GL-B-26 TaxID=2832394 RepID=UPI001CBB78F6|nr:hypothetical protein [Pseudomonas sp. GL-B-26]